MKILFTVTCLFISIIFQAQVPENNPHYEPRAVIVDGLVLSNDTTYDVSFYHLDLEIGIDNEYIKGDVKYNIVVSSDSIKSIALDLDEAFIIDSISFPAISFEFLDNKISVNLDKTYFRGDGISFAIYYQGVPPVVGGIKGLVYKKHDGNEPVIASLSTPYLAHKWWPCKDGTFDKPDSVFVDITIKDTVIANIPVIAVSNGVLDTIVAHGGFRTFKWKHKYPIVPYYVMVAISNYRHFQQSYSENGISFPLDYYVFDSDLESAKKGVENLPDAIKYFSDIFGSYPFSKEKYGMTQLGFYGAIENQTNTIINNMDEGWFYVSVHELAHQWFADMITCSTWHHGWLNEGFANYAEALYEEHVGGFESYKTYMSNFRYFNDGTIYMDDISDPFNVFRGIIYSKGAYVLHMLRGVMGDTNFFNAIKKYALDRRFQYGNAATEDFQKICEVVSGMELDYFFEQWIYDKRYPVYRYNFKRTESGTLDVYLNQIQSDFGWREVFKMPIEIKVELKDGTNKFFRVLNENKSDVFSFMVSKEVVDVVIDPNDWILKKIEVDHSLNTTTYLLDESGDRIKIYPNPSDGRFSISFDSCINNKSIELSILDLNKNLLFRKEYSNPHDNKIFIAPKYLVSGVYLLSVKSQNNIFFKKLSIIKN